MRSVLFMLLSGVLSFCSSPIAQLEEQIIGKWVLDKVIEAESDVTEEHNPKGNRWIEFKGDGTFMSDGDPYGRNTGKYVIDNTLLYVDSDAGEEDDSEWSVTIEENEMLWKGIGSPRAEGFRLIHRRE